jgi:hypothetical protein
LFFRKFYVLFVGVEDEQIEFFTEPKGIPDPEDKREAIKGQ